MTVEFFLQRLDGVRRSGRGWMAKCPAHADRSPSLSVSEAEDGKILVHCFAGCSIEPICETIGIEVAQLFYDSDLTPSQRRALPPQPKRFDWRGMSSALEFASESHWLRAENIFKAARQCDVSAMNDEDLNQAWRCLGIGFHSLLVSENLGTTAFQIRVNGLVDEVQRNRERKAKVA